MGFFKNYLKCDYRFLEDVIKKKNKPNVVTFNKLPSYYSENDVGIFFNKYGDLGRLSMLGKPEAEFNAHCELALH